MTSQSSALAETVATVRKRIARASSRRINEQNTKATLIEPVLEALGWDVKDVEEVHREFKIKRRDKPVDYGLLVLRTPRLFIEAKALGENLDDRRWTNQIMGYAGVAGVEWIVLTDGDEYRIYNTHAPVSVDEKLFRAIRISDEAPIVQETLELLAKDRMEENRIEVLWRAHFVDRRVEAALEQLFSPDSDMLLVNHIAKQARNLTVEEVRASLTRCEATFAFPISLSDILKDSSAPLPRRKKERQSGDPGPSPKMLGVTPKDLIDGGYLQAPVRLTRTYKGREFGAEIQADGTVLFDGDNFDSLSMAASTARAKVRGRRPNGSLPATNGWTFWRYKPPTGEFVPVDQARREFLQARASTA